jgi:hypothetical protein
VLCSRERHLRHNGQCPTYKETLAENEHIEGYVLKRDQLNAFDVVSHAICVLCWKVVSNVTVIFHVIVLVQGVEGQQHYFWITWSGSGYACATVHSSRRGSVCVCVCVGGGGFLLSRLEIFKTVLSHGYTVSGHHVTAFIGNWCSTRNHIIEVTNAVYTHVHHHILTVLLCSQTYIRECLRTGIISSL